MGKLDNKVAVVSGAARGQGRSHAVNLAAEGASIIAFDICADLPGNTYPLARPEDLDETALLAEKEGVPVHTAIVDVRERAAVWKAIEDGVAALGRLDIVVANAGICAMGKGQTIQSWSDTIDTDLVGVFNVIQASLPHLNDGGSVIATGSLAEAEAAFPAMQAMPVPYIEPQDVSNAVLFLASDDSRFITGTQLRVDAGGFVKSKPYKG